MDNYFTLTMAGRGETLHALLGVFPADAHVGDGNLAAALSMDNILTANSTRPPPNSPSLGDWRQRLRQTDGAFDVYLAVIEGEARPPAQRSARGSGSTARTGGSARRSGRRKRAARTAGLLGTRTDEPGHRGTVGRPSRRRTAAPRGRPRPHAPDSRPFIEVGCLAHLALAAPLTGSRCRSRSS